MNIPGDKKIVCITGSVWTGSRSAPRRLLIRDGFLRPVWTTTRHRITDAQYRHVSETQFHMALADDRVLAHTEYAGDLVGIMKHDFISALETAERGVLIVAPQEIAAQLGAAISLAAVFTFKDTLMETSPLLKACDQNGQLHRIDVDPLQPGAWNEAYHTILETIGLPIRTDSFF